MTRVRVKGFKIFADRHGKMRCYHRGTGTAIDLEKAPIGTAEFFAECARISELAARVGPAKPGTLHMLITEYRAGMAFADLGTRTRSDYQRVFDYLAPIGDTALIKFDRPLIIKIRDRAAGKHGRRFGNYVRQVFSLLFAWGHDRGFLASNPAIRIKGIRKAKDAPEANRPWSDAERHAVLDAIPSHMELPLYLMMFCGLDPQDAVKLPRNSIVDGRLDTQRGKTAEPVWQPLPTPLMEALARAPKHAAITLCANSRGRPWTVSGYRASWRPIRQGLEETGLVRAGLTLKGLRHTAATILREMGYDFSQIAEFLGQRTEVMAKHYSRRADRSKHMSAMVKDFDREVNKRRQKLSNLPAKVSNHEDGK
jgi:integrase